MTIPFVIDNQQHTMADVLNIFLSEHKGRTLDIATSYFNVGERQLRLNRTWYNTANKTSQLCARTRNST